MHLKSEIKSRILFLTLNRPDRGNSLYPPLIQDLRQQLLDAQSNRKVRGILITGAGEKDFCTGIDIKSVQKFPTDAKVNLANTAGDIATLIYSGKPTVIALNGRTMGMGVVFSVAADYRLIVDDCVLQMPEVNFGAFPGASCIVLMQRVCGVAWTRRILMLGEPITSNDALNANIADEVCPADKIRRRGTKIAKKLARKNPINLKSIKQCTNAMPDLRYMQGIDLESQLADWYEWDDTNEKYQALRVKYNIKYGLTGDAQKLMDDYGKFGTK